MNVDQLTPAELRAIAAAAILFQMAWSSNTSNTEVEKHRLTLARIIHQIKEAHDAAKKD